MFEEICRKAFICKIHLFGGEIECYYGKILVYDDVLICSQTDLISDRNFELYSRTILFLYYIYIGFLVCKTNDFIYYV